MNIEGNLTDAFKEGFSQALEKVALGEKVAWDAFPVMVQDKGHAIYVVVMISGTVINTIIQAGTPIGDVANITPEGFENVARVLMDQLLTERSKNTQELLRGSGDLNPGILQVPNSNGHGGL